MKSDNGFEENPTEEVTHEYDTSGLEVIAPYQEIVLIQTTTQVQSAIIPILNETEDVIYFDTNHTPVSIPSNIIPELSPSQIKWRGHIFDSYIVEKRPQDLSEFVARAMFNAITDDDIDVQRWDALVNDIFTLGSLIRLNNVNSQLSEENKLDKRNSRTLSTLLNLPDRSLIRIRISFIRNLVNSVAGELDDNCPGDISDEVIVWKIDEIVTRLQNAINELKLKVESDPRYEANAMDRLQAIEVKGNLEMYLQGVAGDDEDMHEF